MYKVCMEVKQNCIHLSVLIEVKSQDRQIFNVHKEKKTCRDSGLQKRSKQWVRHTHTHIYAAYSRGLLANPCPIV